MSISPTSASRAVAATVETLEDELVAFRRDLHAHPELAWAEARTTHAGRRPARRGRHRRPAAAEVRAGGRHRWVRRGAGGAAPRRPRRPARRRPHRGPVAQHGRGRRPRLRARRARLGAPRCRAGAAGAARAGRIARTRPAGLPAGGGDHAGRGAGGDRGRSAGRRVARFRPALRPLARRGPGRHPGRPDHRRRRQRAGPADRSGWAHLASAPDPGPHLRARRPGDRAARSPEPPARPARRGQPGVGRRSGRLRGQRHPLHRRGGRHRPDARPGGLGRRRAPGPRADRPDRRAVRRRGGGRLRAGRAPGGQRPPLDRRARRCGRADPG